MLRTSRLPTAPWHRAKNLLGTIPKKDESGLNAALKESSSSNDKSLPVVEGQFDDVVSVQSIASTTATTTSEAEDDAGLEEDEDACVSSLDTLLRAANVVDSSSSSPIISNPTDLSLLVGDGKTTLENLNFWRQKYLEEDSDDDEASDEEDGEHQEEEEGVISDEEADCYGGDVYHDREAILFIQNNTVQYTILQAVANDNDSSDEEDEESDDEDECTGKESPTAVRNESSRKSFDYRYQQLQEYYKEHGHGNVPSSRNSTTSGLGRYLANQRSKFRTGVLDPSRPPLYRALKITGFDETENSKSSAAVKNKKKKTSKTARGRLSQPSPKLQGSYSATTTMANKNKKKRGLLTDSTNTRRGRGRPPQYYTPEDSSPIKKQKRGFSSFSSENTTAPSSSNNNNKKKKVVKKQPAAEPSKRGKLNAWFTWEERMAQLQEFKDREGHVHPRVSKTDPDGELGQWLSSKRSQYKKGVVKPEHLRDLRRFGCHGFGK